MVGPDFDGRSNGHSISRLETLSTPTLYFGNFQRHKHFQNTLLFEHSIKSVYKSIIIKKKFLLPTCYVTRNLKIRILNGKDKK